MSNAVDVPADNIQKNRYEKYLLRQGTNGKQGRADIYEQRRTKGEAFKWGHPYISVTFEDT